MAPLSSKEYEEWLRMRKRTMVIFFIQTILIGMDFSLTFLTLWSYLKELVKPDLPLVYYSIISVSFLVASLALTMTIGHYVDQSRNVLFTFLTINTIVILGNLIYALPYSPWLLVVGRLLAGVGGPLRSVMSGEISRSFSSEELPSKISYMGMAYALGFVLGPISNLPFKNLDITIKSWRITYANIAGLYMAAFFLLIQVLSCFMLYDLSKIYDMKMETVELKRDREISDSDGMHDVQENECLLKKDHPSSRRILIEILRKPDMALILLMAFFQSYLGVTFNIWLPLIVVEKLNWSISSLDIITLGTGSAGIISCIIMIYFTVSNQIVFLCTLITQIGLILMEAICSIEFYHNQNPMLNIILWVPFCSMYALMIIIEEVFLISTLAQMVSSKYQVFTDGIRLTMYRLGALTALSSSALIFNYMKIVAIIHSVIIVVLLALLIVYRKSLKSPKIVVF